MSGFGIKGIDCGLCIKYREHGQYLTCRKCKRSLCLDCLEIHTISVREEGTHAKITEGPPHGGAMIVRSRLECGSEGCSYIFKSEEHYVD